MKLKQSPHEEAIRIIAKALDDNQSDWIPEGGFEDLLLWDPRYPIDAPPDGLKAIAAVAVNALSEAGWTPPSDDIQERGES